MNEVFYHITQIEPQKKNPHRYNIYLDDAFAFGLDEEVMLKHPLHEGDTLSESFIDDVLLSEEKIRAKKAALRLLSYRARSVRELKGRLLEKAFPKRIAEQVIDDFIRVGLLNDNAFARAYVQTRLIQKPMSVRLIRQELASKGVDENTTERAIRNEYGDKTDEDIARSLVEKQKRILRGSDAVKARKRIFSYLQRRGFSWDVISSLLEEMYQE